ncbi:MAG: hypothetical protein PHO89_04830 [Methylacidiphilaceae bacterium]|nr:hypothetical protein [Candidatus Methylacidiphilaceae bacterium]
MIPGLSALPGLGNLAGGLLGNPSGVGGAGGSSATALQGQMSQMLNQQYQVGMMMTMFQTQSSILGTITNGLEQSAAKIH